MRIAFRFPFRKFSLVSPLSVAEAQSVLGRHVVMGPRGMLSRDRGEQPEAPFRGKLEAEQFEMVRRIAYRNSFLPLIRGTIRAHGRGAIIHVSMRMWMPVIVFAGFWMSVVTVAALFGIYFLLTRGEPLGLVALAMALFGAALFSGGFGTEAVIAEQLLRDIFGAETVTPR